MESAWQGATFYRGTSRTDAQKLDCHRKVFRIRIRQHLTQGLGIHRAPLPFPNTLAKRDSGDPNKRNLGFGSANFPKCMWILHMYHNDFSVPKTVPGNAWGTTGLLAATPLEDPGGRPENISMATQLSCARAGNSFIQWCSTPRGLHIKSLLHFLVNVC